ncbi:MAG: hypothetical protein GYA33_15035 [Thermogutta sp.]|nr:hypothetical protein [Thermogutta sp.]
MLILSRRPNEKLVLPTVNVAVQVVKILGNSVRLGIEAPGDVPVYREELLKARAEALAAERPALNGAAASADSAGPSPSAAEQLERVLDCLAFAFDFAQAALDGGEIQEARRVLEKAFRQVERIRSECLGPKPVPGSRSPRLLLVAKGLERRRTLAKTLRDAGYEVEAVEDGCRALDVLSRCGRPDIVLLDSAPARSPCGDAAAAVQAIRGNPACNRLKVIGLRRKGEAEVQVSVGSRGVDRWIEPSASPESLLSSLESEAEAVRV